MSVWDASFEAHPLGDDFGSVTSQSLRQLLEEFYARFTLEHTITEGPSPTAVHTPGATGVCGLVDDPTPFTKGVLGAFQYSRAVGVLFIDSSSVMSPIGGSNHSLYTLNLLLESAHPQYLLDNAAATYDTLTGQLTVNSFANLDQVEADYSGYAGGFTGTIIARAAHKGVSASGGNKHVSNLVSGGFHAGRDKLKVSTATVANQAMSNGVSVVITIGDYALMPFLNAASGDPSGGLALRPNFIDVGTPMPSGALNPIVTVLSLPAMGNWTLVMDRSRVDPS